jgi:hypothetical protein
MHSVASHLYDTHPQKDQLSSLACGGATVSQKDTLFSTLAND